MKATRRRWNATVSVSNSEENWLGRVKSPDVMDITLTDPERI
jgi:hypothetical protein